LNEQWRVIEGSREEWEREDAELRKRTDEAIREWETECKATVLYAAQDRDDGEVLPSGTVTPRMVRHWIKQRSGIDTIVYLDRGVFSVKPLHPERPMGFTLTQTAMRVRQ
jgi:hypothetical protein